LILAARLGKTEVISLLLRWKANVAAKLEDGRNALDVAIDGGHEDCAMVMIEDESWKRSLRNATEVTQNSSMLFLTGKYKYFE